MVATVECIDSWKNIKRLPNIFILRICGEKLKDAQRGNLTFNLYKKISIMQLHVCTHIGSWRKQVLILPDRSFVDYRFIIDFHPRLYHALKQPPFWKEEKPVLDSETRLCRKVATLRLVMVIVFHKKMSLHNLIFSLPIIFRTYQADLFLTLLKVQFFMPFRVHGCLQGLHYNNQGNNLTMPSINQICMFWTSFEDLSFRS